MQDLPNLGFGTCPDVITNLMVERLAAPSGPTAGQILRPSNGEPPKNVAFIQCAGSRDENHLPYCSAVCCSASLKQAIYFVEQNPENHADIFYIDLRVSGRNEDFLKRVENHDRIRLIKGKASGLKLKDGYPIIEAEDILSGKKLKRHYTEIPPSPNIIKMARQYPDCP